MKNITILIALLGFVMAKTQNFTPQELQLIEAGTANSPLMIYQTNQPHQHDVLLAQSTDIDPRDKKLPLLIDRMKVALANTGGGVGIAGPQVGVNRNVILVQRFDKENQPVEYFINPKIIWKSELQSLGPEGDLSIADFRDLFYRSQSIQLEYFDLSGGKHTEMVEGFTSVIFQHEIDHLFGILITDKLEKQKTENFVKVDAYQKSN